MDDTQISVEIAEKRLRAIEGDFHTGRVKGECSKTISLLNQQSDYASVLSNKPPEDCI